MNTQPTDLPRGDRPTTRGTVRVPLPVRPVAPQPAPELYAAPTGKLFQLVGADPDGVLLFIPAELDPAKVARWVWAREDYLVDAFEGPMVRVERAA